MQKGKSCTWRTEFRRIFKLKEKVEGVEQRKKLQNENVIQLECRYEKEGAKKKETNHTVTIKEGNLKLPTITTNQNETLLRILY